MNDNERLIYDEFIVKRIKQIQKELGKLQDNQISTEELRIKYFDLFYYEGPDIIESKILVKERTKK